MDNNEYYTNQEWQQRAGNKPVSCKNDRVLTNQELADILVKQEARNLRLNYIRNGCGFGPVPKRGQV